jgi:hypothetical protein
MPSPRLLLVASLCATLPLVAQAQEMQPPRLLQIGFEQVKFGKSDAHERNEAGWPSAFAAAKSPYFYFALVPMTGGADVLYVSGYQTYAEYAESQAFTAKAAGLMAKLNTLYEKDAEFVNSARGITAAFRADLTIGPAPDFPNVRGWRLTTIRVRVGQADEFTEARRMMKAAFEKAGLPGNRGVFQVTNGVNTPTFLVWRPFASLAEFDGDSAGNATLRAQYAPGDFEKVQKLNEGAILTSESNIYMVSAKQSYVPASYASIDFWKSNPVFAAAAAKSAVTQAGKARESKKP